MSDIELFQWTERTPMQLPRAGCAVAAVGGKLLVAGGTYWREGKKFWCADVTRFDPSANRWETVAPLPQARGDAPAAVLGDTLYVFGGGADGMPVNTVFAFQNDRWSVRPEIVLPAPRRSFSVVVIGQTFFLFGGMAGIWTDYGSVASTFWAYEANRGWWSLPYLPGTTRFNVAIGVVDGRIIVAGGCSAIDGQVRNLDEIFSYDPDSRSWTLIGRLSVASRGASGLADGNRLFYFGGYTDKFETAIWSIDPASGWVKAAGQLPCGLADTRFARIGTSIIGATGENGIKMRFAGTIEASRG